MSRVVGRRAELDAWCRNFEAGDGPTIVVVRGKAGIGKSRLIEEFAQHAAHAGAVVHRGAAFPGWQAAFGLWVEAFGAGLLEADSWGSAASAEATLRVFTGARWRLVAAAGERRLVVVLDDLHWADSDSLRFLEFIAPRLVGPGVVVVLAHRDPDPALASGSPLCRALEVVLRGASTTTIDLAGLTSDEVGELVAETLGGEPPAALVRAIGMATDGNPLFVRELARHLAATGQVVSRDGRWSSNVSTSELGIPATVRLVVRERLAGLSDSTVAVLQVAAVAAATFELERIASVANVELEAGLAAVDDALSHGLIESVVGGGAVYRFAHALVRDAVAEMVNPTKRLLVHAALAEVLRAEGPEEHAVAVAGHMWLARGAPGITDSMVAAALFQAARQLAGSGAHREAIECADRLVTLLTSTGRGDAGAVAAAWSLKATAAAALLDASAAVNATRQAMVGLDASRVSMLVARVVSLLREGVPRDVWEPLVTEAFERLATDDGVTVHPAKTDAAPSDLFWARLVVLVDPVELVLDGPVYAGRWTGFPERALAALRASPDEGDRALAVEAFAHRSIDDTQRLLLEVRSRVNPVVLRRGLDLVARDLVLRHGQVAQARRLYDELLAIGMDTSSIPAQLEAHAFLAFCDALLGDLRSADGHLTTAGSLSTDLWPTHRLHALTPMMRGVVAYCRGEGAGEGDLAAIVDRLWSFAHRRAGAGPFSVVMLSIGAATAALGGEVDGAREMLEHAVTGIERLDPFDHGVGGALWFGAAAAYLLGDVDASLGLMVLLDRQHAAGAPRGPCLSFAHSRGRLEATRGRDVEAATALADARRDYLASGHRSLAAMVDAEDAALGGPSGAAVHARAMEACTALGMSGWSRRLADRLPSTPRGANAAAGVTLGGMHGLSTREVQVLRMVASGLTNHEIADRLVLSPATINRHVANVYLKLGTRNRSEATAWAHTSGLMTT